MLLVLLSPGHWPGLYLSITAEDGKPVGTGVPLCVMMGGPNTVLRHLCVVWTIIMVSHHTDVWARPIIVNILVLVREALKEKREIVSFFYQTGGGGTP